jgi:hypothetical protein
MMERRAMVHALSRSRYTGAETYGQFVVMSLPDTQAISGGCLGESERSQAVTLGRIWV